MRSCFSHRSTILTKHLHEQNSVCWPPVGPQDIKHKTKSKRKLVSRAGRYHIDHLESQESSVPALPTEVLVWKPHGEVPQAVVKHLKYEVAEIIW